MIDKKFIIRPMILFVMMLISLSSYSFAEEAKLLFRSSFDGIKITRGNPHKLIGTDTKTGYRWPDDLPGDPTKDGFNYLIAANNMNNWNYYVENKIVDTLGMNGDLVKALYIEYKHNDHSTYASTRVHYNLFGDVNGPTKADRLKELYIKYKIKMNFDMSQPNFWRNMMEWGDAYQESRIVLYISRINGGAPYWRLNAEYLNVPGKERGTWWEEVNKNVPVPINKWFELEVYWNRSSKSDGIYWVKVNGVKILEHIGPNKITKPWTFFNPFKVYGVKGSSYITDVEIWSGIPAQQTIDSSLGEQTISNNKFIMKQGILQ